MNKFSVSILILAAFTFWASSSSKETQEVRKTPTFNWEAKGESEKLEDFKIALLNPYYADDNLSGITPFKEFSNSLEGDFESLITKRGFSFRGPFSSRDEMVYEEKEESDLALKVEIKPNYQIAQGNYDKQVFGGECNDGSDPVKLEGAVIQQYGKIKLTAMEPLSGEKLWVQSVSLPQSQTPKISSSEALCTAEILSFLNNDTKVANAVIEMMQESYGKTLDKIWNQIDPREFKSLRSQIKELKENKRY